MTVDGRASNERKRRKEQKLFHFAPRKREKMAVEETPKPTVTDDQISEKVRGGDENVVEGEVVGDDDAASSKLPTAIGRQPHPLENSWTFWFDNPSVKSKQAAWGSSIRPIYTFATVEEFWRFAFPFYFLFFGFISGFCLFGC